MAGNYPHAAFQNGYFPAVHLRCRYFLILFSGGQNQFVCLIVSPKSVFLTALPRMQQISEDFQFFPDMLFFFLFGFIMFQTVQAFFQSGSAGTDIQLRKGGKITALYKQFLFFPVCLIQRSDKLILFQPS